MKNSAPSPRIRSASAFANGLRRDKHLGPLPRGERVSAIRRRGVVLVLVLGAVAILSILAVEVSHRASLKACAVSRVERNGVFDRAFQSGIAVAQALITEGRNKHGFDYAADPWNRAVELEPEPGVRIHVTVRDEAGKLNIANALTSEADAVTTEQALRRLFQFLRMEDSTRGKEWEAVEEAVIARLGLEKKEDGTREKVAPLLTLDGLREAGLSRELVFGPLNREEEPDAVALADLFTVRGKGILNLNTAPKSLLFSLDPEFDVTQVERIAAWRGDGADDPRPFASVEDLAEVEGIVVMDTSVNPPREVRNLLRKVQDRVAVSSNQFSARIIVRYENRVREGWAFLEAEEPKQLGQRVAGRAGQLVRLKGFEEIEP